MIPIPNAGLLFGLAFALMLLATWLMGRQGKHFFTKDPLRRPFSILELEFPAKSFDLARLINGIYLLPEEAARTVRAVKNQLLLDYLLFIPATYGGIYILCMHVASQMTTMVGRYWFIGLAWAQAISFLLDYSENTYLWIMTGKRDIFIPKQDPDQPEITTRTYIYMQVLETIKWGLALIGFVCAASVMAYLWLSGLWHPC